MTPRLIVRCTEGHPYDRNAHDACPVCGAAPAGPEGAPAPAPTPASQRLGLIVGVVGVVIGLGGVGLYFYKPTKQAPVVESTSATEPKAEPKTAIQADVPKNETAKSDAPKGETTPDTPQATKTTPDAGPLAQNLKRPPETDAEAAARVSAFMTVDPAVLEPLRRALSPIDPKDVDPLLASLSPAGSDTLHLSVMLREMLVNQRANQAYADHDIGKVKILVSALVSEPPLAPGVIPFVAYKNLAFLLSQDGDPQADLALAGRLALAAAKQGFSPAVALLDNRPAMVTAAQIDASTLSAVWKLAVFQDPQLAQGAAKHGVDANVLGAVRSAFNQAMTRRDWAAAILALQSESIGGPQAPWMYARFARTMLFEKDNAKFLDRSLIGSVTGAMAAYPFAADSLGIYSGYGLDGVVKDAPNAAVWTMLVLKNVPANEASWNNTRNRYAQFKQALTREQSQALAQMAQQLGAP